MRNFTRNKLNEYLAQIATLNHVNDVSTKFNVDPSVQQTLEQEIQESVEFLKLINILLVQQQEGEKVGIGVSGPIASRTDTTGTGKRTPRDVSSLKGRSYHCRQINYDTAIRYPKLDAWAHKPDFQILLRNAIVTRQGLDRIMIGWNGISAAATTNLSTNPLLEDVAPGWLQKMRAEAASQVMSGVQIGTDYQSLDGLIYDAKSTLLKPWYRSDPGLVAIIGDELLTKTMVDVVDSQKAASEKLAMQKLFEALLPGGVKPMTAPFFPSRAVWIGRLDNLSIYVQEDARRRHIKDNPEKDQIENFESSNDDFVVEDHDGAVLIENIKLPGE